MATIDLAFRLTATQRLPADHGYPLYSALSRTIPEIHSLNGIGVHPIRGRIAGLRQMTLTNYSRLILRVPDERIAEFLPLAGKPLIIGQTNLRVGVPEVRSLIPAPALRSRLVVIKVANTDAADLTEAAFIAAARKQASALGVSKLAELSLGKRRTIHIKRNEIVGYEVVVEGLMADESLALQEHGLGGRRHMGCGLLVALK